jgi:hypothetical protein
VFQSISCQLFLQVSPGPMILISPELSFTQARIVSATAAGVASAATVAAAPAAASSRRMRVAKQTPDLATVILSPADVALTAA